MKTRKPGALAVAVDVPQSLPLQHGRSLSLLAQGADDVLEVRGHGGTLELRIRMSAEGPVLTLEGVTLSLKAVAAVSVECANFKVSAREGLELSSQGALSLHADHDLNVDASGDVRVTGSLIHLN